MNIFYWVNKKGKKTNSMKNLLKKNKTNNNKILK